jgi:hypothetical protein
MSVWDLHPQGPSVSVVDRLSGPEPLERWVTVMGLDLGQSKDRAAAGKLKRRVYSTEFRGPRDSRVYCTALRVWDRGTDYTVIAKDVLDGAWDELVVDFGGPGRPWVDLFRLMQRNAKRRGFVLPVTTADSKTRPRLHHEPRGVVAVVPKTDIATSLKILQESGRLVLPNIEEVELLKHQLGQFTTKRTEKMRIKIDAKRDSTGHGDLVMGLGLAAWRVLRIGDGVPAMY